MSRTDWLGDNPRVARFCVLGAWALFSACSEGASGPWVDDAESPSPNDSAGTGGGSVEDDGSPSTRPDPGAPNTATGGTSAAGSRSGKEGDATEAGGSAADGGSEMGGSAAGGTDSEGVLGGGHSGMSDEQLKAALQIAAEMDGDALVSTYSTEAEELSHDPTSAQGLDVIQASRLALDDAELARLGENGLVISHNQVFPSFAYGYKSIYSEDLPVYVSADSLLEALHRTYDSTLKLIEERMLAKEVATLLSNMRSRISEVIADPQLARDADLYLAVAESLFTAAENPLIFSLPEPVAPVTDLDPEKIATLLGLAQSASGSSPVELFGSTRQVDFSQFKPRGHYDDSRLLQAYFKGMMWLGRIDLRMMETQQDGSQTFRRRDFDAAIALKLLMNEEQYARFKKIDTVIGTFVGERDSMSPEEMNGMLANLGVSKLDDLANLSDEEAVKELQEGGWGAQRIASRLLIRGPGASEALPRDKSFLIFGQRYTVDSHTFVNTTDDRVPGRMMPDPLDAAFAALGNDSALNLLGADLANESYVAGLAQTRVLVDAHGQDYWESSLYTRWLDALSLLSPQQNQELSGIANTDGWQRRILNTQLGSWSQLRHDTILYSKQSYTSGATCEFPDAYVDPYPEFYGALAKWAEHLVRAVRLLPPDVTVSPFDSGELILDRIEAWSELFVGVMTHLEEMAENQQSGTPHSEELLQFINAAVYWDEVSGYSGTEYLGFTGWYMDLFMDKVEGLLEDPIVADVHTQPYTQGGAEVGRVLHVGTGLPRLMVLTADTCMGPRAYAGLAYSYGELITEDYERLTDNEWQEEIATTFPDVPWMTPLIGE